MRPKDCPETSVPNYQSTLRNISEERRSNTADEAWNHVSAEWPQWEPQISFEVFGQDSRTHPFLLLPPPERQEIRCGDWTVAAVVPGHCTVTKTALTHWRKYLRHSLVLWQLQLFYCAVSVLLAGCRKLRRRCGLPTATQRRRQSGSRRQTIRHDTSHPRTPESFKPKINTNTLVF